MSTEQQSAPAKPRRIISARECTLAGMTPIRRVLPTGAVVPRAFAQAVLSDATLFVRANEIKIETFNEVVAQVWPLVTVTQELVPYRRVVLPIDGNGAHDGDEVLHARERLRLNQFKQLALVGLTSKPRARGGLLTRFVRYFNGDSRDSGLSLSSCLYYDAIDRQTGTYLDYDDAFHHVSRNGKLSWLAPVFRGPFLSWAGCADKYKPVSAAMANASGQDSGESSFTFADGRVSLTGALLPDDWIRGALLERYQSVAEFLLRPTSESTDENGQRSIYLIRRDDWERESFE